MWLVLRDIASRVAQSTINVQRYNMAPFIQIATALAPKELARTSLPMWCFAFRCVSCQVTDTQPHFPTADPSRTLCSANSIDSGRSLAACRDAFVARRNPVYQCLPCEPWFLSTHLLTRSGQGPWSTWFQGMMTAMSLNLKHPPSVLQMLLPAQGGSKRSPRRLPFRQHQVRDSLHGMWLCLRVIVGSSRQKRANLQIGRCVQQHG